MEAFEAAVEELEQRRLKKGTSCKKRLLRWICCFSAPKV